MFQTTNQYSFQDISPPILAQFFRDNANFWRDVFSSTMGFKIFEVQYSLWPPNFGFDQTYRSPKSTGWSQ